MCVQVVSYVLPESSIHVNSYDEDGIRSCDSLENVFQGEIYKYPVLKLMQHDQSDIIELKEIPIRFGKKVSIEFSPDG